MYISLYRKYRPQKFSDMVGQSAAVSVLGESLKEGRLGHAYLLSGPRGCGKTSAARIVAKSLICQNHTDDHEPCGECDNCNAIALGEHLDVIEIDGASNRGIGEIRDLKSHVNLKPLIAAYKVYIIDEVHMLTEPAFNALLKTLEEPPANVVFLLATTEPHKVPVTIRSRCQHIPFHRISIADMVKRVEYVCKCENITTDTDAIWEISRQADGALRDALSLTEQAVALGKGSLTMDCVRDLMGGSNRTELEKWIINLRTDAQTSAADLHSMLARGISIERFTESLFAVFRDLWIFSLWGENGMEALEISDTEYAFLKDESVNWSSEKLKSVCMLCNRLLPRTRYGMRQEVFSGLLLIELMSIIEGTSPEQIRAVSPVSKSPAKTEKADASTQPVKRHYEVPIPVSAPEPAPFYVPEKEKKSTILSNAVGAAAKTVFEVDNLNLGTELGDNDFSKLISKLGSKSLAIGAALLNCEIVKNKSGWDFYFSSPSPSQSFLLVPQNRRQLASALNDIWGIKDAALPDNTIEKPMANAPAEDGIQSANDGNDAVVQKTASGLVVGSTTDRIVKLLGAELLYVKDANIDRDDEPQEIME